MQINSFILKLALILIPIVFVIVLTIGLERVLRNAHISIQLLLNSLIGIIGAAAIYLFISFISKNYYLEIPSIGDAKSIVIGAVLGLIIVFFSGGLYRIFISRTILDLHLFSENLGTRILGNLGVVLIEEVGFRGGSVFLMKSFWGDIPALIGGSLSFGIAHFTGRLLGRSVSLMYFVGTTMSGLLLTLTYFHYGLLASFSLHLVWNVLERSWIKALKINGNDSSQRFEGAWTTIFVLIISSAFLLVKEY